MLLERCDSKLDFRAGDVRQCLRFCVHHPHTVSAVSMALGRPSRSGATHAPVSSSTDWTDSQYPPSSAARSSRIRLAADNRLCAAVDWQPISVTASMASSNACSEMVEVSMSGPTAPEAPPDDSAAVSSAMAMRFSIISMAAPISAAPGSPAGRA